MLRAAILTWTVDLVISALILVMNQAEIAMDPKRHTNERALAISYRGSNPQSEDVEMFIRFLGSDAASKTKQRALRDAKNWPVEQIRPVVRHVMQNETDPQLIKQAMSTLAMCYMRSKDESAGGAEAVEDARLIQAVANRPDSPDWLLKMCEASMRVVEGHRGPWIGDKWPWERSPSGGK